MHQTAEKIHTVSIDKSEVLRCLDKKAYFESELGTELVSRNSDGWTKNVSCPFHPDQNPSFGVNLNTGAFKCLACGEHGDLIAFEMRRHNSDFTNALKKLAALAGLNPSESIPQQKSEPWNFIEEYIYLDADGKPYRKIKKLLEANGKKQFPQYRYNDGEWISGTKNQEPVPYNLPEVNKATLVLIAEGEKDCNNLTRLGFVASCNPGGAGNWTDSLSQYFVGKEIIILPENDKPGKKHGLKVATILYGKARSIKVIQLPGLPEKGDVSDFIARFNDPDDAVDELSLLVNAAVEWTPEKENLEELEAEEKSRFKLVHVGELVVRAAVFLIKGLLEADSLALIFGDPGTFKSFLAIAWACSVTTGKTFMGRAVKQGPVVYIAGEGQNGLARRFKAWAIRNHADLKTAPLFVSTMPAGLCDIEQAKFVTDAIDAITQKHGPPVLIVIDTVARNFGAGDENSTKDMSGFISSCDVIRSKYQATVLLVHHSGHGDKTRARGAMALKGALDAEYRTDIDETGVIRLEATKMKDAEFPAPMAFRSAVVELGITDDDGNPVTSVILDETTYEPPAKTGKEGRGKWQTVAVEVLENLYAENEKRLSDKGYDSDTTRVSVDDWRKACINKGITSRTTMKRIRETLLNMGTIEIENGFISLQ
jgi:hypothetical protein